MDRQIHLLANKFADNFSNRLKRLYLPGSRGGAGGAGGANQEGEFKPQITQMNAEVGAGGASV